MLLLNLGCGKRIKPGYVNVDYDDTLPGIDEYVDLNQLPWPWDTGTVGQIMIANVAHELMPLGRPYGQLNQAAVMQEIWRVLKPGGSLELIVPSTDGKGAFADPMAVTFWNDMTLLCFLPGQHMDQGYPKFEIDARMGGVLVSQPDGLDQVWIVARLKKPGTEEIEDDGTSTGGECERGSEEGSGDGSIQDPAGESGQPEVREQPTDL